MGYRVMIADGPAAGWDYVTMVPPDPVIAVAPVREDELSRGPRFMRVLIDEDVTWPGQVEYERDELPDDRSATVDEAGDVLVEYRCRT